MSGKRSKRRSSKRTAPQQRSQRQTTSNAETVRGSAGFPSRRRGGVASVLAALRRFISSRSGRWLVAASCVLLFVGLWLFLDWWIALPPGLKPQYVGGKTCVECHQQEYKLWKGSFHELAMAPASPETVLGDFNNAEFIHYGVKSRMFRRGDEFYVNTVGPDGKRADFKVKYVIGWAPLQQYMVEFPDGRVQVLPVSWDTEEKCWFCMVPDKPYGTDDPLFWTGTAQNWNHMCADCHVTNFKKGYDLNSNTYHSTFSEINVSCEACHGPGSLHVQLARSHSIFWDRRYGYGLPQLNTPNNPQGELEACAPCHSHRQRIYPGFQVGQRYLDHYALSLLEDNLYFPDGQILEEVYVYGSFLQSKMYRNGVRCSNCHNPHSCKTKYPDNRLCTQCHIAAKYDTQAHHHHDPAKAPEGVLCKNCHMPIRYYMVVDPRRDHSLRPPRPDLTVKLGVPNACNQCHVKDSESAEWAAKKIVEWYGPKRNPKVHYGEVFAAARKGEAGVKKALEKLTRSPNVGPNVRATAVELLGSRYPTGWQNRAVQRALHDREPLVRAAAVNVFVDAGFSSPEDAARLKDLLVPALKDPVRLVRINAARALAGFPRELFSSQEAAALDRAVNEYRTGLSAEGDQAGSHVALGVLDTQLGQPLQAVQEYRTAIRLDPSVAGPRSNLAQLLEELGRPQEARRLRQEEERLLARDATLMPDNAAIRYRLGLLQYLLGEYDRAVHSLQEACRLEPQAADFQLALTLLYEKLQRWPQAVQAAERLLQLQPDNKVFQSIKKRIVQQAAAASNDSATSK